MLPKASIGYIHKIIKNNHVKLNNKAATGENLLCYGDEIAIKESGKMSSLLSAEKTGLDLLFEDDFIVVINKKPGIPVHKTAEDKGKDLVTMTEEYFRNKEITCKLRPVNRIDKGTSGAVILAKSATSAGILGRFVKEEGLGKVYIAAVQSGISQSGEINIPLDGKESLTRYNCLIQGNKFSILAIYPLSGRMHQIRRHLSGVGYPIIGDLRYGGAKIKDYPGHALHAFITSLKHPEQEKIITIHAPMPDYFISLLQKTGKENFAAFINSLPLLRRSLVKEDGLSL